MNSFSSFFLLILLLSHFFPHSAMRNLEDAEINKVRESPMDLQDKSFVEDDHIPRKALHEVHSGPNPISNSIPQQKCKTKLRSP